MEHDGPEGHLWGLAAWTITDGKAGDEGQALALAEALGLAAEARRARPRAPYALAAPWGPADPREAPGRTGGPLAGPLPALAIGSGRRAVPLLRTLTRLGPGRPFTVCLKDPRTGPATADALWVPAHDPLRAPNVLATLTPPHRVTAARLAAARAAPDPRIEALPRPRLAVLVGGPSRHHRFGEADARGLLAALERLVAGGASPMISASRRTPLALNAALRALAVRAGGFHWDAGAPGPNPYVALLALADAVLVTADSANMLGEAAATGAPLLAFEPAGGHPKLDRLLAGLRAHGALRDPAALERVAPLAGPAYPPLDATPTIAAFVAGAYREWAGARAAAKGRAAV